MKLCTHGWRIGSCKCLLMRESLYKKRSGVWHCKSALVAWGHSRWLYLKMFAERPAVKDLILFIESLSPQHLNIRARCVASKLGRMEDLRMVTALKKIVRPVGFIAWYSLVYAHQNTPVLDCVSQCWLKTHSLKRNTLMNQGCCCDLQLGQSLASTAWIPASVVQPGGGSAMMWGTFLAQIVPLMLFKHCSNATSYLSIVDEHQPVL